jgi:hypothetical protein
MDASQVTTPAVQTPTTTSTTPSVTPASVTAPTAAATNPNAGMVNGGWYGGRQYWNGQLGAPGVIANPNQTGFGQAVSDAVNQQSSVAQGQQPDAIKNYLASIGASGASSGQPGSTGSNSGDLSSIYNNALTQAGVPDLMNQANTIKQQIQDKTNAFNDASANINANPFYSEATRGGRLAAITDSYNNDVKALTDQLNNINDSIKTATTDATTQLDIATKQFDMNNTQAKTALDQFNTLLSSGALTGATASDIASFASQTGLPTSFIKSAIASGSSGKTQLIQTPNTTTGTTTLSVVDTKTGKVLSSTQIQGGTQTAAAQTQAYQMQAAQDTKNTTLNNGYAPTLQQMLQAYNGVLTPQEIYNIYNANSPYGTQAKESPEQLAAWGIKDINTASTITLPTAGTQ